MKEMKNVNTVGMFDIPKGILMLLIVLGHSVVEYVRYWEYEFAVHWWYPLFFPLLIFVYGFIPMFFMMSGYGFRKQSMKRCIQDRVKYLLKPYAYTGLIVLVLAVLKIVVKGDSVFRALTQYGVPFLIGLCPGNTQLGNIYLGSIGPMWFIVVLAVAWIALNIIMKLEKQYLIWMVLFVLVAFAVQLPFYAFIPFCIVQSLTCICYIYVGYVLKKEKVLLRNWTKSEWIVLWLVLLCIVPFGSIEISQNMWKLGMLDYAASLIAGILFLKYCTFFSQWKGKIADFLCVLGRHSMDILCVHSIEYLVFPWKRLREWLPNNISVEIFCILIIRVGFIIMGCIIISRVRKVKYK